MKTNTTLALVSALTLMIVAQPAHGMQFVNKGLEKAKENWKPLAGAVAVVGIGYGLWKVYNSKQIAQQEQLDKILNWMAESQIQHIIEQCTIIQCLPKNTDGEFIGDACQIYRGARREILSRFQNLANEKKIQRVLIFNNKQLSRESQDKTSPLYVEKDLIEKVYINCTVETFKPESSTLSGSGKNTPEQLLEHQNLTRTRGAPGKKRPTSNTKKLLQQLDQ